MAERHEIRLCGSGGQGMMLAGYIIGQAASIFEHKYATYIRDYGPAARGGTSRADVVVSDKPVLYPRIDVPSVLIAMSQQAYDQYRPRSSEDTLVIIDEELVKHREQRKHRLLSVPATRMAEELGSVTVANVVMLGFLAAVTDIVSLKAMRQSVLASVPKGAEELNGKALKRGYTYGLKTAISTTAVAGYR